MRGFIKYNGALRECEVKSGAAYIRDNKFKRLIVLSIAGIGTRRFGDAEIPALYKTEADFKDGVTMEAFENVSTYRVLKEILGDYTISSDKVWHVTRFKLDNGKMMLKTFRLPASIKFLPEGPKFIDEPDFGDYTYPTLKSLFDANPKVVKFEDEDEKPGKITFTEEDACCA